MTRFVSSLPGLGAGREPIELEHAPIDDPSHRPSISSFAQSSSYFETIHLPLLEGRDFTATDGAPQHAVAVVTRDFTPQDRSDGADRPISTFWLLRLEFGA